MSDPVAQALRAAARSFCICDGECFETRHGMMHGPCEAMGNQAAAAIAAFLRTRARRAAADGASTIPIEWMHEAAAAVERAAQGERG